MANKILLKKLARRKRIRAKMHGSAVKPRLSVNRSNKFIYVQAIDDENAVTVASASDIRLAKSGAKMENAKTVAEEIAKQLKAKKITNLIFDRGHYKYHGRVKAVAEALREQGLHV